MQSLSVAKRRGDEASLPSGRVTCQSQVRSSALRNFQLLRFSLIGFCNVGLVYLGSVESENS